LISAAFVNSELVFGRVDCSFFHISIKIMKHSITSLAGYLERPHLVTTIVDVKNNRFVVESQIVKSKTGHLL
jgi:hypothetical protein